MLSDRAIRRRAALILPALTAAAFLVPPLPRAAEIPRVSMTLAQAEAAALSRSPSWAAAKADSAAALERADASFADAMPRLVLSGYYSYQDVIASLSLGPGLPTRAFASHDLYGLGPGLTWTLWDQGALKRQWEAQRAQAASQEALARLERRRVRLATRLAYFQVQLAREQLSLLADSSELAEAEYRDIAARLQAGAASRLDALSAHQEALARRRDYLDAQANLGAAWSELAALIGDAAGYESARAGDARRPRALLDLPPPTFLIAVDALEISTKAMAEAAASPLDPEHPRLKAYAALADAARLSARAARAGTLPKVQAAAALTYQYPNIPVLETIWQKSAGLSASLPLWEFGRSRRLARGFMDQAAAAENRRAQALDELTRDRQKALGRLSSLETERPLLDRSLAETSEIARLTYAAYRDGHSTFLEVQSANLRAVQARASRAAADEQALIELAILASLAPEKQP